MTITLAKGSAFHTKFGILKLVGQHSCHSDLQAKCPTLPPFLSYVANIPASTILWGPTLVPLKIAQHTLPETNKFHVKIYPLSLVTLTEQVTGSTQSVQDTPRMTRMLEAVSSRASPPIVSSDFSLTPT